MKVNKKICNTKKIDKAILEIKTLQIKYGKNPDTIIVYHALDSALKQLGWDYAELLGGGRK
jgi:hypothetical protein